MDKEMSLCMTSMVVHKELHALVVVQSNMRLEEQGLHIVVLKEHSLLLLSARNNTVIQLPPIKISSLKIRALSVYVIVSCNSTIEIAYIGICIVHYQSYFSSIPVITEKNKCTL